MQRFTLKVAVYLFLIKDNKIFLLRRFKTGWHDGDYSVPAGHLDSNETIVSAIIRETKEEVGITLKEENLTMVHTMHRVNSAYIDFFYVAENWAEEPKNLEPNKCDDLRQFDLENLPPNMVPSVKSAIENYKKGISFSEFDMQE